MQLIEQSDALIRFALTATPGDRLSEIEGLAIPNDDGEHSKPAIKRLNKLLMTILKARDEIAVELQQESWRELQQDLPLAGLKRAK